MDDYGLVKATIEGLKVLRLSCELPDSVIIKPPWRIDQKEHWEEYYVSWIETELKNDTLPEVSVNLALVEYFMPDIKCSLIYPPGTFVRTNMFGMNINWTNVHIDIRTIAYEFAWTFERQVGLLESNFVTVSLLKRYKQIISKIGKPMYR